MTFNHHRSIKAVEGKDKYESWIVRIFTPTYRSRYTMHGMLCEVLAFITGACLYIDSTDNTTQWLS